MFYFVKYVLCTVFLCYDLSSPLLWSLLFIVIVVFRREPKLFKLHTLCYIYLCYTWRFMHNIYISSLQNSEYTMSLEMLDLKYKIVQCIAPCGPDIPRYIAMGYLGHMGHFYAKDAGKRASVCRELPPIKQHSREKWAFSPPKRQKIENLGMLVRRAFFDSVLIQMP